MPLIDILTGQLSDLFRIGLIIALVITTTRNAAVTGKIIPLIAGVVFVAVIIPVTLQTATAEPLSRLVMVGIGANLILLAAVMALFELLQRLRK